MSAEEIPFEEDRTIAPQGLKISHTNLVGNILGEFEIVREIGRGGMGIVYEGFQKNLNRKVAVKVLPESFSSQANFVDRFHKEAEVLASLSHPNIIPIFNYGAVNDIYYFAMEFVDGTPLSTTLSALRASNNLMSHTDVLNIIRNAAEGLGYAHKKEIYHMDVKPGNILIDKDGAVMVADFGLVRIGRLGSVQDVQIAGTPMYMSPEQILGGKTDHRSDIYSLGCVFYELLTGSPPFTDGSIKTLISKVAKEPPIQPSLMDREIPVTLDSIVMKMLEKTPGNRYQSMAEFLAILDRYQKGLLSVSIGEQKSLKRHSRLLPALIAAGILTVMSAIAAVSYMPVRNHYYGGWAKTQLTLAQNYEANNVTDAAVRIYKDIARKVPTSLYGKAAKKRLGELGK